MQSSRSSKSRAIPFPVLMLIVLASMTAPAQDNKKPANQGSEPKQQSAPPKQQAAPPRQQAAPTQPAAPPRQVQAAPSRSAPPPPSRPAAGNTPYGNNHAPAASAPHPAPAPSGAGVHNGPSGNPPYGGNHAPTTSAPHSAPAPGAAGVHNGPAGNAPPTGHTNSAASPPLSPHHGPTASSPAAGHTATTSRGPATGHAGAPAANATRTSAPATNNQGVPKGSAIGAHSNGILGRPAPRGSQQVQLKNGSAVQRRPNGRISDVHDARRGMNVHHGINGNTRVVVVRADHSRVFAERGRPGYVQRGYNYHGHEYSRRTYYHHGRAYDRYYRAYPYRGVYINVYAPYRYYPAGFYGWAYNPWYHPIVYSWGWGGAPWYGYYGGYFSPYASYPTAAFWLTDYIISTELANAYQARQEAQVQMDQEAAGSAPLTPDVKQMIADEVKNQLALENAEAQQNARNQEPDPASSGIGRMLTDGKTHVFVAGGALDVVNADGNECALSDGDALELATPPPPDATSADLVVLSSKGGRECRKSDTVAVSLGDLQDMQNHMRETIDQGLQELQSKQGTGGLPAAPPSAQAPPVDAPIAQGAPPPDPNGAAEVNQQLADADQSEKEVTNEAQQEGGTAAPAAGPTTIALGQSIDQVTASLGQPETVVNLGPKKIYKYKDMKVTFKDGKVSDVE